MNVNRFKILFRIISAQILLKVCESSCLFRLKLSVTVTSKEIIFLANCPILNLQETVHLFQADQFLIFGYSLKKNSLLKISLISQFLFGGDALYT